MEQLSGKKLNAECSQRYKGPLKVLEMHRLAFQVMKADSGYRVSEQIWMEECHRRNSDVSSLPPMLSAAL